MQPMTIVVAASGVLLLVPRGNQIRVGPAHARTRLEVWIATRKCVRRWTASKAII